MAQLKLVIAPSAEPVTTAEAKTFLRVDSADEDTLIDLSIAAATQAIESFIGKKLITQTWDYWLDRFPYCQSNQWWDGVREGAISELHSPQNFIAIPLNLSAVSFVRTIDDASAEYTMDPDFYVADTHTENGRVSLKNGASWPTTVLRPANGIQIRCVAGFGPDGSDVPATLRLALLNLVGYFYENRGDHDLKIPDSIIAMLQPYMRMKL